MPPHMLPVLGSPTVVNIVGVCDSILYKAISGVLMPTVLQALPDRYLENLFLPLFSLLALKLYKVHDKTAIKENKAVDTALHLRFFHHW